MFFLENDLFKKDIFININNSTTFSLIFLLLTNNILYVSRLMSTIYVSVVADLKALTFQLITKLCSKIQTLN